MSDLINTMDNLNLVIQTVEQTIEQYSDLKLAGLLRIHGIRQALNADGAELEDILDEARALDPDPKTQCYINVHAALGIDFYRRLGSETKIATLLESAAREYPEITKDFVWLSLKAHNQCIIAGFMDNDEMVVHYYKRAYDSLSTISDSLFFWDEAQFWSFYGPYYHKCLEYNDKERYVQMDPIMKAPFCAFYDKSIAFERWADLDPIYRHCLGPLIFKELKQYADFQLSFFFMISSPLNQNTKQIMHSFLYHL